jgi:hypothetical protein
MTARRRRPERTFMKSGEAMSQSEDFHQRIRALEALPDPGRFVGIIFPSDEAVVTMNDAGGWFLVIPEDLDGTQLFHAHAAVATPSGAVTVMYRNSTQTVDMLTTPITIDAGETTSYTAAVPPVIDEPNAVVSTGDLIVVDVDDDGGALGLDVILAFV